MSSFLLEKPGLALLTVLAVGCFSDPETLPGGDGTSGGGSTTAPATTSASTGSSSGAGDASNSGTTSAADDTSSTSEDSSEDDEGSSTGGPPFVEGNLAFVSSSPWNWSENPGLDGADTHCNELAAAANLDGTYVAWLSSSVTDASARLGAGSGWRRADGKVVAESRAALLAGDILHPVLLDENGAPASNDVLTATSSNGTGWSVAPAGYCDDWSGAPSDATSRGSQPSKGSANWTFGTNIQCGAGLAPVYCLGIDHTREVTAERAEGRLAFITTGTVSASATLEAFDALCQLEGEAARPGSTFLAFVSTGPEPSDTPLNRFDLDGPPWVNAKEIELLPPDESLVLGELTSPVGWRSNGQTRDTYRVWVGVSTPTTVRANCNAWSTDGGVGGRGSAAETRSWMSSEGTVTCDSDGPIICFET